MNTVTVRAFSRWAGAWLALYGLVALLISLGMVLFGEGANRQDGKGFLIVGGISATVLLFVFVLGRLHRD